MNNLKRGTPLFGLVTAVICLVFGIMFLTIGFWKTLLLAALMALGYFIGAVDNKEKLLKSLVNKMIPEKKQTTIHLREDLKREQGEWTENKEDLFSSFRTEQKINQDNEKEKED